MSTLSAPGRPVWNWIWRRSVRPVTRQSRLQRIKAVLASLALSAATLVVYFALCELIVRIATHSSLFEFQDFRAARGERNNLNTAIEYEPTVGWVLRPFIESRDFNTIEHGFRSNGDKGVKSARTGGVLAVGSSFTAGSEVSDAETWPAQLEFIAGLPVNNAGVGNYSADQIILRAEQLIPVVKPKVVVIDLLADNILGVTYSSYAFPKPYFLLENGSLIAHHQPVPPPEGLASTSFDIKTWLAHSILVDRFMATFFSDRWFSSNRGGFIRTNADEVEITCHLLDRLKRKTDDANVKLILYLQFAGSHVIGQPNKPIHATLVNECAESFGIHVIDEFAGLRSAYNRSPDELRRHYVRQVDGTTGHKSAFGNRQVANLVQDAMNAPPVHKRTKDISSRDMSVATGGAGKNLVVNSEMLHRMATPAHVKFTCQFSVIPGATTYRLEAAGDAGEHYIPIGDVPIEGGLVIASTEVKAEGASKLRFQLVSSSGRGAYADFDFDKKTASVSRIGETRGLSADIERLGFGWYRVWLRATFPPSKETSTIIIQLADGSGSYGFQPKGEAVLLRKIQVTQSSQLVPYDSDIVSTVAHNPKSIISQMDSMFRIYRCARR